MELWNKSPHFTFKFMPSASDLDPASYMVKGPAQNIPVKYGHVGPDGLDQR